MKNISKNSPFRQGEITLQPVKRLPRGICEKSKRYIVGHSETGHHHVLESETEFEVFTDKEDLYLRLFEPAKLNHQKTVNRHHDLVVAPGIYKVTHKTEYSPFTKAIQQVWD